METTSEHIDKIWHLALTIKALPQCHTNHDISKPIWHHKSSSIISRKSKLLRPVIMAAASAPVEIGSRGTIGFLISQEIEYFSRIEVDHQAILQKLRTQISGTASTSRDSRHFDRVAMNKKQANRSKFLPSICAAVDIAASTSRIQVRKSLQN